MALELGDVFAVLVSLGREIRPFASRPARWRERHSVF